MQISAFHKIHCNPSKLFRQAQKPSQDAFMYQFGPELCIDCKVRGNMHIGPIKNLSFAAGSLKWQIM
jgi:hypothetical protein